MLICRLNNDFILVRLCPILLSDALLVFSLLPCSVTINRILISPRLCPAQLILAHLVKHVGKDYQLEQVQVLAKDCNPSYFYRVCVVFIFTIAIQHE